jgi:membrane-associated phospholipid phosphatase
MSPFDDIPRSTLEQGPSMESWQIAGVIFFGYVFLVGAVRSPRPPALRRVLSGAVAGLVVLAVSMFASQPPALNHWIWPPLVLLIAYWSSGLLFVKPSIPQESALRWLDDRLDIRAISRRTPQPVVEVLEAAYAGVYLLVPLALLIHLQYSPSPDPGTFWSVVLITDFVCFAVLPWVQSRPPRALEDAEPWASSLRHFNLRLLGATSIQVNTFPSGHAAEGLAAALLVLAAPAGIVFAMLIAALAVSAGAVLGRYHYLADALAGWVVAVVVYVIITK